MHSPAAVAVFLKDLFSSPSDFALIAQVFTIFAETVIRADELLKNFII